MLLGGCGVLKSASYSYLEFLFWIPVREDLFALPGNSLLFRMNSSSPTLHYLDSQFSRAAWTFLHAVCSGPTLFIHSWTFLHNSLVFLSSLPNVLDLFLISAILESGLSSDGSQFHVQMPRDHLGFDRFILQVAVHFFPFSALNFEFANRNS